MSNVVSITKADGPQKRLFDNEFEQDFYDTVNSDYEPLSSGIDDLDDLLGGGFYPDMYVIAAPTGNGKTTLAMQIAANTALYGTPVVYVALEMSRKELQSKHITRIMHKLNEDPKYKNVDEIPTAQKVLYGAAKEAELFKDACTEYFTNYAPNICTVESVGNTTVEKIKQYAEDVAKATKKTPLIIIDYLQVLGTDELRYNSERQRIDKNVLDLKRLSRSLEATVLVLSSMSRTAVDECVNSFKDNGKPHIPEGCCKESGTIEYTAGTLLGMFVCNYDAYVAVLKSRFGEKTNPDDPAVLEFNGVASTFGSKSEYEEYEQATGVGTKRK